jgi:hypothetical protein
MAPPLAIPKKFKDKIFFLDHVFINPSNVASTTLWQIMAFQKVQLDQNVYIDQNDVHFD